MYTREDWSQFEDMQDELNQFGSNYIDEFYSNIAGSRGNYYFEHADIEGDFINITYEWSCMGGHETEIDTVPLHYLWMEPNDWIAEEKTRLKERRVAEEKKEQQRLIDKRNNEIKEEKAQFLELQKKYGEG